MSLRAWNYIAVACIVVSLVFLRAVARLVGWQRGDVVLAIVFIGCLVLSLSLFLRGIRVVIPLTGQNGITKYLPDAETASGNSMFMSRIVTSFIIVLSAVGLVCLLLAASLLPFHDGPGNPSALVVPLAIKTTPQPHTAEELYLDLLKKTLTRAQVAGHYERYTLQPNLVNRLMLDVAEPLLHDGGYDLVGLRAADPEAYMRASGSNTNRLEDGETMVGLMQLDNVQACVRDAQRNQVPGDLIEAGAWRGGVTILMRGILKAYDDRTRLVWVADSFSGLPPGDPRKDALHYNRGDMAVSLDEVKDNFARYGLLDDHVRFLKVFLTILCQVRLSKSCPSCELTPIYMSRL